MTADQKVRLAARAALDRKALDPVILDVRGLSGVTDYFLL
jgi:ribosomal silencing factor RsfS